MNAQTYSSGVYLRSFAYSSIIRIVKVIPALAWEVDIKFLCLAHTETLCLGLDDTEVAPGGHSTSSSSSSASQSMKWGKHQAGSGVTKKPNVIQHDLERLKQ